MSLRVAVLGAGAAGLAALRHLAVRPGKFSAVAFEQTKQVGGTWVYSDKSGDDRRQQFHSALYKNLKTNLPKEIMAFPDFAFPSHLPSFAKHQTIRQYLEDYTDHFKLRHLIQPETMVERVHPTKVSSPDTKWEVTVRSVSSDRQGASETQIFDSVIICNGHHIKPAVPDIPGLGHFRGIKLHSRDYVDPTAFKDKRVVLLGAANSGQDISLEMASVAKEVIICHRKPPLKSQLPKNMRQAPGIKEVTENSVVFDTDEEAEADVIVLCTGYQYSFPFLSPECHVKSEDGRVTPMYKHLIHTEYPSLSIVGLCRGVCPFPQFHCQVKFVMAALDGSMKLPTTDEMNKVTQEEYEWRLAQGMPHRFAHQMVDLQWDYNDDLAELAQFDPIPPVTKKIFERVVDRRCTNLTNYKCVDYEIKCPETFREVPVATHSQHQGHQVMTRSTPLCIKDKAWEWPDSPG